MYSRILLGFRWIGAPAGMLALAALACEEQQTPQAHRPVATAESRRIISLSPGLSRLIVEFGLASQIVGADSASRGVPELASSADLGDFETVDAAAIADLEPTLVFALAEEGQPRLANALRDRGIPVHVFAPTSANEVIQSIHALGAILDRKDRAQAAGRRLTREISSLATVRDGKKRLRVAWIIQRDPLRVVGNRGLLHEVLELAGGEIAFHQLEGESVEVSLEGLAANAPDLVLDSTPMSEQEPIEIGVRFESLPTSVGALPTLDLLGRIRVVHGVLYPQE